MHELRCLKSLSIINSMHRPNAINQIHDPPMRMLSLGYVMIYQRDRMIMLPIIVVKLADSSSIHKHVYPKLDVSSMLDKCALNVFI